MKELSPTAKNLLAHARQAGAPDIAARSRVERALLQKVATGAAGNVVLAKAAAGVAATAAKGVLLAGLSCAALWGGWKVTTSRDVEHPSAATPAIAAPLARVASEVVTASSARESKQRSPTPKPTKSGGTPRDRGARNKESVSQPALPASDTPTTRGAVKSVTSSANEPHSRASFPGAPAAPTGQDRKPDERGRAPRPAARAKDTLAEEARRLRVVQQALRSGDGARALELVREDNARFSSGLLQQERTAARVQALCLVGQSAAARAAAESFEQRWPRSPLLARVRSTCR
jgi:hypothetical protein